METFFLQMLFQVASLEGFTTIGIAANDFSENALRLQMRLEFAVVPFPVTAFVSVMTPHNLRVQMPQKVPVDSSGKVLSAQRARLIPRFNPLRACTAEMLTAANDQLRV